MGGNVKQLINELNKLDFIHFASIETETMTVYKFLNKQNPNEQIRVFFDNKTKEYMLEC